MEKKLRFYPLEQWEEFKVEGKERRYAVSNYGRIVSFLDEMETGNLLNGSSVNGYLKLNFKYFNKGKITNKSIYVHKLVAQFFANKPSDDYQFVIHLDYNHANNYYKNLKWVTKEQMFEHNKHSPYVKKAHEELIKGNIERDGRKLTATQVIRIKMKLADPNRKTRMKVLAKQFGVSEMQLYRIKTGENWGHIKID
jgi:hypothetical protein